MLILGVAYKGDVGDLRESPALKLIGAPARHSGAEDRLPRPVRAPARASTASTSSPQPLTDELLAAADIVCVVTAHPGVDHARVAERRTARDRLPKRGSRGRRASREAVSEPRPRRDGRPGRWGQEPAAQLRHAARVRPALVLRPGPDALAQQARAAYPNARLTASYDDLLDDAELEAVVLATPVPTHYELARQALLAGKHVIVEKPMTWSAVRGPRPARRRPADGRVLMVGHLLRYHPAVEKLRELIDAGELGDVRYVYGNRVNLGTIRPDENVLWSLGVHDISVVLHLIGDDPDRGVGAGRVLRPARTSRTSSSATSISRPARSATCTCRWLDPHKMRKMTVVGTRKMAVFDDMEPDRKVTVYDKGDDPDARGPDLDPHRRHLGRPTSTCASRSRLECGHFLEAVATRRGARGRASTRACASSRCSRRCRHRSSAAARRSRSRRPRGDVGGGRGAGPRASAPDAVIGAGVLFGANVTVHEGTVVGDGCSDRRQRRPREAAGALGPVDRRRGEVGRLRLGPRRARLGRGRPLGGVRARRRLRRRRPRDGARARDDRRGRRDRPRRLRRERHRDRRVHEDPDERLHHGQLHARGARLHRPVRDARRTTTSWAAPSAATP